MRRWSLVLIAYLWIAPGIAAVPAVPAPPSSSLPKMQSRARQLGSAVLVAAALDHRGMKRVLARGGYVGGSEREFFGRTTLFDHVTEQVLRFEGSGGAASYLRWLRAHAAQSLGEPRSVTLLGFGTGGVVFRPKGCGCHSETPTYLLFWRRGPTALSVLASGPGATATTVTSLARRLDRAVS